MIWNVLAGGIVWLAIVLWPLDPNFGIGLIEKLFLLAPLVIVPMGLLLSDARTRLERYACCGQPVAAALVVASFFLPQGSVAAGVVVLPWLGVTLLVGMAGLVRLWRGAWREAAEFCFAAALTMLAVGGLGLTLSRFGLEALGYREPLVLLVAVHFHYAAFVSPLMAGAVGRRLNGGSVVLRRFFWLVAIAVSVGSPILAWGYVLFLPGLRLLGATLLTVGLFAVALLMLSVLPSVRPRGAQWLLAGAAGSVVFAMLYATVYAVADYFGTVWIAIPHMARTHGMVNALGFSVCGLLGWVFAKDTENSVGKLRSLTRRWMIK
jgi:hypothetical protein